MSELGKDVEKNEITEKTENSEGTRNVESRPHGSSLNGGMQNGNNSEDDVENVNFHEESDIDGNLFTKTNIVISNGHSHDGKDVEFIVSEYEIVKEQLLKLQHDYKLSLDREKTLCEKLQFYHGTEDSKLADLSAINDELRTQLNALLEDYNSNKDELKR